MRIILVDDQTLVRRGLISILSLQKTMEVCGEAKNKLDALLLIQSEKPDLVIVDFHLGQESGLDLITETRQQGSTCKFAILTYSKDSLSFKRAKAMNVDGYISRESNAEELIYAFQLIQRGRTYYDPDIIDLLLHSQKKSYADNSRVKHLTSKEIEVLQKLGIGFSNKQISECLFITENTVKKHVSQVLSKLDLGDRTQAALYANVTGLVQYEYSLPV